MVVDIFLIILTHSCQSLTFFPFKFGTGEEKGGMWFFKALVYGFSSSLPHTKACVRGKAIVDPSSPFPLGCTGYLVPELSGFGLHNIRWSHRI